MLQEAFRFLGLATPFAYAAAIYGLFHFVDKKASGKAKLAVSRWLKSNEEYSRDRVGQALVEGFDRIYGTPLLSFRSLLRSAAISIVITVIVLVEFPGVYGLLIAFAQSVKPEYFPDVAIEVAKVILFALFLNVLSDYISLFAVRFWLKKAANKPYAALLAAPLVGAIIISGIFYIQWVAMGGLLSNSLAMMSGWKAYLITSTNIYAALIVHLWLPLFAIGVALIRLLSTTRWAASNLQWFLKQGQHHPFEAIGYVVAVLVFVISAIVSLLGHVWS